MLELSNIEQWGFSLSQLQTIIFVQVCMLPAEGLEAVALNKMEDENTSVSSVMYQF